ncbi:MAG: SGNH/GDSL hydrolase family protein [Sedimentisphaerales bacterium]|nr:SGNH/GDSL hydrolase family protein [Sedimentisphaerales bacterium]
MKKYLAVILLTISLLAGCSQTIDYQQNLCQGKWLWNTDVMYEESLMFFQEENVLPSAQLLFTPSRLISVKKATGDVEYESGVDFILTPGSRTIILTENSRIPRKNMAEMYPPPGPWEGTSIPACRGKDRNLFYSEGHVFHDLQVVVTYEHKNSKWQGPVPVYNRDYLPRTQEKLRKEKSLNVVLFGDSISTGANASGVVQAPPFNPFFGQIVADTLAKKYDAKVSFKNLSKGGMSSGWGKASIQPVVDQKPDLVILAWGMNDASGRVPPEDYKANLQAQIDAVRAVNPQAEFILVATMTANPEWTHSSPEHYDQYRDILPQICNSSVVLADVTSTWKEIVKNKKFLDLAGNGINHPNDFGHRIYAEVILALLIR